MGFAESGNMGPADFAAMANGSNGFSGDGAWWIIILFLFALFGNGFGGGIGAGNGAVPYVMNTQTDATIQRGFDQSALMTAIQGVNGAVTTGFGDVALGLSGLGRDVMAQGYQGQISTMQGFNTLGSQFAQACCDNRLGIANLGADIAREACADRQAVNEAFMGLSAQNNANTNLIINTFNQGIQSVKDLQVQQLLDSKDKEIARLERENSMLGLAASQTSQTQIILEKLSALTPTTAAAAG